MSSDFIAHLRDLENTHVLEPAAIGRVPKVDRNRRDTSAFDLDREVMPELYEHLSTAIECANRELGVTTTEFEEPLRYLRYAAGGHFSCHVDHFKRVPSWLPVRKLSFTVPLSRREEYDGGDLELFFGLEPTKMPQEPGNVIVFPSFVLHQVNPVTRGVRRSLVGWVLGPAHT